jgi:uncharacterized protein
VRTGEQGEYSPLQEACQRFAPQPGAAGPLPEGERIDALDVLRGFALLGILVVNIQSFSMPDAALFNPTAYGDLEGVNRWVWYLTHVLFEQKFMTIFSMLFGAGILLMTARAEEKGLPSVSLHFRRMTVLLGFGLAHAYLVWDGDILVCYAMCGFVVYFFRGRSARSLVALGLGTAAVSSALSLFFGWSMPYWPAEAIEEVRELFNPSPDSIAGNIAAYRGGWAQQAAYRAPRAFAYQTFVFAVWGLWRSGGLMLVGMGLFKLGVLSAVRSPRFYASLAAAGILAGVPCVLYGVRRNFDAGWDAGYSFFTGSQYNYWASILVSLGLVGIVMLVCRTGRLRFLTPRLAAVGRTAFTNYIVQSLICTTVFYGHGFGLFGSVERSGQILIVLAVWGLQLFVSPLWLRYFGFGPLEWLWRSLTYRKIQAFRRIS